MKKIKGFTLIEILLAVMIVGLVGVALAALTTSATRESGVGRTRIILRDSLSLATRQMRQDVASATQVLYVRGAFNTLPTSAEPLLLLRTNSDYDGNTVIPGEPKNYITYCFVRGNQQTLVDGNTSVRPGGSYDGGAIYRRVQNNVDPRNSSGVPICPSNPANDNSSKILLRNVKYIPKTSGYPVPLFRVRKHDGVHKQNDSDYAQDLGSQLYVNLIVEANSSPVVNDVTEQIFTTSNGFAGYLYSN